MVLGIYLAIERERDLAIYHTTQAYPNLLQQYQVFLRLDHIACTHLPQSKHWFEALSAHACKGADSGIVHLCMQGDPDVAEEVEVARCGGGVEIHAPEVYLG